MAPFWLGKVFFTCRTELHIIIGYDMWCEDGAGSSDSRPMFDSPHAA